MFTVDQKYIEILEILSTKYDEKYDKTIITCLINKNEYFDYYEKYDSLRTFGTTSMFFIREVDKERGIWDLVVNKGELLLNTPYKYATNLNPVPYELQDAIEMCSAEDKKYFQEAFNKDVENILKKHVEHFND